MVGTKYFIYIKMAIGGMNAMKKAITEAKADGEVTAEEKFAIGMAFFVGLFASVIGDE